MFRLAGDDDDSTVPRRTTRPARRRVRSGGFIRIGPENRLTAATHHEWVEMAIGTGKIAADFNDVRVIMQQIGKSWISRDLRHGDLYSLRDVASGLRPDGLSPDQADRLGARGFVRMNEKGLFKATFKGRLALWIRHRLHPKKS
jgi:hypothetical protein